MLANETSPSWDTLFTEAATQHGNFTAKQAADHWISRQLVQKYLANGQIRRVLRGVYAFNRYPDHENAGLAALWLWARGEGVFSHETALALHEISDVLPTTTTMILPSAWRSRRLRIPEQLTVHWGEVPARDLRWLEAIPLTSPRRTIQDCIDARMSPETIEDAIADALGESQITEVEATELGESLESSYLSEPDSI
jgi:predicted transcriptional regulator of viral defense system